MSFLGHVIPNICYRRILRLRAKFLIGHVPCQVLCTASPCMGARMGRYAWCIEYRFGRMLAHLQPCAEHQTGCAGMLEVCAIGMIMHGKELQQKMDVWILVPGTGKRAVLVCTLGPVRALSPGLFRLGSAGIARQHASCNAMRHRKITSSLPHPKQHSLLRLDKHSELWMCAETPAPELDTFVSSYHFVLPSIFEPLREFHFFFQFPRTFLAISSPHRCGRRAGSRRWVS